MRHCVLKEQSKPLHLSASETDFLQLKLPLVVRYPYPWN